MMVTSERQEFSAKGGWCMSDRGRLEELIGDLRKTLA